MPRLLYPDLLRTFAIALMVAFHAAYDLTIYYGYDIGVYRGGWLFLGRTAALLFLLLAGVSTALHHETFTWNKVWLRARRILAGALLVTMVTFVIDPGTYVRFGILHLIGVMAIVTALLRPLGQLNLGIGFFIAVLGFLGLSPDLFSRAPDLLRIVLGFPPLAFMSVDYYPLLPWGGVIIAGYGLGQLILPWLRTTKTVAGSPLWLRWLSVPGRYSLSIYLVHQPVILGVLWIILR